MSRRRSVEVFSLSFLDCICCGFGAMILMPLYFQAVRPPVLKDYFDPRLRQILRLTPTERQVVVKYTVETRDVPRR